jgi:hypothetical protein
VQPLLGLTGFDRLANERLFGDDVMDFEEVGQFVRFATNCAVGQHQRILYYNSISVMKRFAFNKKKGERFFKNFYPVN